MCIDDCHAHWVRGTLAPVNTGRTNAAVHAHNLRVLGELGYPAVYREQLAAVGSER